MLLFLLACLPPPPDSDLSPGSGPPGPDGALTMPAAVPFPALVRSQPATLVDEHGQTLLVLENLGVSVTVTRLLTSRALVRCDGCRAPVEGWLQRSALLPLGAALDGDDLLEDDQLLLALQAAADAPQLAVLGRGLVLSSGGWVAPPWHAEGGYSGPVVQVHQEGERWIISAPQAAAEPPKETP